MPRGIKESVEHIKEEISDIASLEDILLWRRYVATGFDFEGKPTASGEDYDMYDMTAAHPTLPLGSYVRVTNLHNGKAVVVKVNDRGPIVPGRIIDLSYGAAQALQFEHKGLQRVRLDLVKPRTQHRQIYETVAYNHPLAEIR